MTNGQDAETSGSLLPETIARLEQLEHMMAVTKLNKDLLEAAKLLSPQEARFLVTDYYLLQRDRVRAHNQLTAYKENTVPTGILEWHFTQAKMLENNVRKALGVYSNHHELGVWAQSVRGIGPVLSAGLLAHVDVTKAPTCSSVWRFAGLDPTAEWKKGEERPWNEKLKTLCWKLGESFVKVSGRDDDVYGHIYAARKDEEAAKNAAGDYESQAVDKLKKFKISKATKAYGFYSVGTLPPGHLYTRAKRYAVKLFLSHYHAVGRFMKFGVLPPRPYAFDHLGHAHLIAPPNMDTVPGLEEAWAAQPPTSTPSAA